MGDCDFLLVKIVDMFFLIQGHDSTVRQKKSKKDMGKKNGS